MAQTLYCPVRKAMVIDLPEERVRVQLLALLTEQLGYPRESLAIEKELARMAHIQVPPDQLPQRRADVICFAKGIHPTCDLYPLLLIECKAVKLTPKMFNQVIGYNHYLKACFIALTNGSEAHTAAFDSQQGKYRFVQRMPSYSELLALLGVP
jgi:hypothetical protein